jgi:hypothetical protein
LRPVFTLSPCGRGWLAEARATIRIDARIAAALREDRQAVIPALRSAVDELFGHQRERHKSGLLERTRGLELAIARIESAVSAARGARHRAREGNRSAEPDAVGELTGMCQL